MYLNNSGFLHTFQVAFSNAHCQGVNTFLLHAPSLGTADPTRNPHEAKQRCPNACRFRYIGATFLQRRSQRGAIKGIDVG